MPRHIYFDYAASTPVDPEALKAMQPYFSGKFGNPGSLHSSGQEAIAAVDESREIIAKSLDANHGQIILTSSATEANNLAIKGTFLKARKLSRFAKPKILVSAIEHESVLESARDLKNFGAEIIYLPVDRRGIVDIKRLKKELDSRVVIVSVMLGNNEIGTIQPVAEISKIISEFKQQGVVENKLAKNSTYHLPPTTYYPLFHSDAAQALPYIEVDVKKLGIDMLTVSSQKIYGPKGAGALYIRSLSTTHNPQPITSIISGGGQEYGLRSGTENVSSIVGFAEAVRIAGKSREKEAKRLAELKAYFWERTKKAIPKAEINGPPAGGLPHIVNIYFPKFRAEALLARLDLAGFAVSAGSACRTRSAEPSYVIRALGYGKERSLRSLRISFGRPTEKDDIDKLIQKLKNLPS